MSLPSKPKPTLRLDWASHEAARFAVEHWHYSRSMPTPPVIKIGVWEAGKFIGVVLFSRGATNNYGKAYGIKTTEVCELTRVALAQHETPVSRIVSIAIKMLAKKESGLRLIISFSDLNQGHIGIIYQAMGFVYCGMTTATSRFRDKEGRLWHSRQVSHTGISRQYGEVRRVPKISECERVRELPKHRYLYPLDDDMRRQIEPLRKPYPKRRVADIETGGASSTDIGGANPTTRLDDARASDGASKDSKTSVKTRKRAKK